MKGFGAPIAPKPPAFVTPDILWEDINQELPAELTGNAPRTLLGQDWWDTIREAVAVMNNRCCYACGRHENVVGSRVDGHERYSVCCATRGEQRVIKLRSVVSLCRWCHNAIHWQITMSKEGSMAAINSLLWAVHVIGSHRGLNRKTRMGSESLVVKSIWKNLGPRAEDATRPCMVLVRKELLLLGGVHASSDILLGPIGKRG